MFQIFEAYFKKVNGSTSTEPQQTKVKSMDEAQYKEKLQNIENEYLAAKRKLHIEYGMSQVKFSKGDIIKYSNTIILIEKISVAITFGNPYPVYTGLELKKDLTPRKDGKIGSLYGNYSDIELVKQSDKKQ